MEKIYNVVVGSYMGKNYGEVKKVTKTKIELQETVPNRWGGWEKRKAVIKLQGGK